MDLAYRSLDHVATERFDALTADRAGHIAALLPLRVVYARRVARSAAGLVATVLGAVLFAYTYGHAAVALLSSPGPRHPHGELTSLLLVAWGASIAAYFIARSIARAHLDRYLARPVTRTGDAAIDLARLETTEPRAVLRQLVPAFERWSVALPLMGLAMLAPLTIHLAVALVVGWMVPAASFDGGGYDGWILSSVVIVGHAHVVLAICGWRFAKRIQVRDRLELETRRHRDWLRAWGFTALASAIPGALLLAIPPLLVLVTGLVFIPAAYLRMTTRVIRERVMIELAHA